MADKEKLIGDRLTVALRIAKQSWENTMPIGGQDAPLAIAILAAVVCSEMETSEWRQKLETEKIELQSPDA